MTLSYTVNATPFGYVVDRESVDPGREARVGLVARDGVGALRRLRAVAR